ncbi:hypothetical protein, partial [Anaerostipes caccae]|uniref:hypothetical protein n=1 Tax=Anaerostipes caccae TaxID=105841 RepID=UPI001A992FF0
IISNLKNPWIRLRIPEGKIEPKVQIIRDQIGSYWKAKYTKKEGIYHGKSKSWYCRAGEIRKAACK